MGTIVYFLVPETKGRSLESMDEIFGSAYGDLLEAELRDYRRDVKGERDLERGKQEEKVGGKGFEKETEVGDGEEIRRVEL
jgi:hypothetical protein